MAFYKNRRVHPRTYYEAPIMYSKYDSEAYHDATMYNNSMGGMYFETDRACFRGTYLYIKMINFSPDTYIPGAYKAYVANVKWIREINSSEVPRYGVGVEYLTRGHIIGGKDVRELNFQYTCDLCGGRIRNGEVHKTGDSLHLCMCCFKYIGGLIDGKIKQSMMRFMIGNIF